jgi:O-antigen ligase
VKSSLNERIGLQQRPLPVFTALIGLTVLLTCVAPRASVPMLLLLALSALPSTLQGWQLDRARFWSVLKDPLLASGLVLLGYLALNTFWALDPGAAVAKVAVVVVIAAAVALALNAASRLESGPLYLGATLLATAVAIGAVLVAVELATGQLLTRFSYNLLPILRPAGSKDLMMSGDRVVAIAAYELNRNLALLIMALWSALLVIMRHPKIRQPRLLAGGLFILVAVSAFYSVHETSMIAIAASGAVFLLSLYWSRAVQRGLMAVWCLGFILAIPLGLFFYQTAGLHKAPWLPRTAQARVIIWGYTAEKIPDHPFLGLGVRSTRVLDQAQAPAADRPPGHVFARRTGRHAHNIFLQSWYELGLVGAALVMLFGIAVLRRIATLPSGLQPYGHAVVACVVVFASLAWGMWQSWLLAGYALTAIYLVLAVRFAAEQGRDGAA